MTIEIHDYPSRLGDPASRRFGTFSYLAPLDADGVRTQVGHIIERGWDCGIEHVEPERATTTYWYMWKLPLFGELDADVIMSELTSCRATNPGHHVRLIGYDHLHQTQGMAIVVARGGRA